MAIQRLLGFDPARAADDAVRALSVIDWSAASARPAVVAYLPVFRGNPFQGLLYSRLPEFGLHALPLYDADQAVAFAEAVANSGIDLIVHPHWLNIVTARSKTADEARDAAKLYIENLSRAKELGARVLWTVHNVLPHDSIYADIDAELRRDLASLADRIHIMSPGTIDLVTPVFDLPASKAFVVPHPAYQGVYPSWMSREQARSILGIPPGTVVFLLIGAIKPYKGLTELIAAFDRLSAADPGRYFLLAAGRPDDAIETIEFCERVNMHPAALGAFGKITESDMQIYLNAADLAVFPYRRSLNSGAVALAKTFGLPVVLPRHVGEAATVDVAYAEIYDANTVDGLLSALSGSRRLVTAEARSAARTAADLTSVSIVSDAFASEVRKWLDGERLSEASEG